MAATEDKTIIADPGHMTVFNPPKRNRACLVQYSGSKLGKRYLLDEQDMVIGRSPTAQIIIGEASVSRQHAKFRRVGEDIEVEDLGSANGTYVNDQKTESRVVMKDGDILRLGTIILKFFAHDNIDGMIQDKIYRMATIDVGTQIFNKQYLLDSLASEMKYAKSFRRPLSVIYYDLDFFKKVNDRYGHNAGDLILKETASLVKATVRKEDILGRFGGEEFIVLTPNTDAKTAVELAERIRAAVEQHLFQLEVQETGGKEEHRQTISVGVAELKGEMKSAEELLEAADKRLYHSKHNGRNQVTA